jgi:hypothetical protein
MNEALKEQARAQARGILANSQAFRSMEQAEQMALYRDVVNAQYNELAQQQGLVNAMGEKGASRDIDDNRHLNQRIEQVGQIGADFIESVDFPQFVEDLLQAVFDANLNVTIKQMQAYQELMKAATASLAKFVEKVDDDEAFAYLAENQSNRFSMGFPDEGSGNRRPVLTDKNGNPVDMGDNEVKAKIMDARLALAREQRALLRETILMGVSRLVVEKGTVKAAVVFDVKASERIEKKDMAQRQKDTTSGNTVRGGLAGLFGTGRSATAKTSRISVSSAKSQSTTDLAANITGSVEINFKSDYFKLDNFAQMYGPVQAQGAAPAGQPKPATPQQLPGQPNQPLFQ